MLQRGRYLGGGIIVQFTAYSFPGSRENVGT